MKKIAFLTIGLIFGCIMTMTAQKKAVPQVYNVENTGAAFAAPAMPTVGQLPVIKDLPDAMAWANGKGRVTKFADWAKRRSEISHMIQHYGIGTHKLTLHLNFLFGSRQTEQMQAFCTVIDLEKPSSTIVRRFLSF